MLIMIPVPDSDLLKDNLTGTVVKISRYENFTFLTISRDQFIEVLVEGDIDLRTGDEVTVSESEGVASKVLRRSS